MAAKKTAPNQHTKGASAGIGGIPQPNRNLSDGARAEYFRFMSEVPASSRGKASMIAIVSECAQLSAKLAELYEVAETVSPFFESRSGPKPHPVFSTIASLNAKLTASLLRARLTPREADTRTLQAQRAREPDPIVADPSYDWREEAKRRGLM